MRAKEPGETTEVVNLVEWKARSRPQVAEGVSPALMTGLIDPQREDFGERIQRIRASLDRINSLMYDLRKMSERSERGNKTSTQASRGAGNNSVQGLPAVGTTDSKD
jgi:hypothetical protein